MNEKHDDKVYEIDVVLVVTLALLLVAGGVALGAVLFGGGA